MQYIACIAVRCWGPTVHWVEVNMASLFTLDGGICPGGHVIDETWQPSGLLLLVLNGWRCLFQKFYWVYECLYNFV